MTDAASAALLVDSLKYGVPAAVLILTYLYIRIQDSKTDRDRKEHMTKWEDMIKIQKDAIDAQKESTLAVVKSHKDEINRMFSLQDRQAQTLESLAHNLSVVTSKIEQKAICPFQKEKE